MRRAGRVTVAVLVAYLLQSTLLPYFKVNNIMVDVITITLFTVGYTCGLYTGLTAGVFSALIMEVASGDLPGLISVICVGAGGAGAWIADLLRRFERPGRRRLERRIKRYAPMVLAGIYVLLKELLYVGYFYLNGLEVSGRQIWVAVQAGVIAGTVSLLLVPFIGRFLLRKPEETMMARWLERRRKKRRAKPIEKAKEALSLPTEGGTDA